MCPWSESALVDNAAIGGSTLTAIYWELEDGDHPEIEKDDSVVLLK